jgi:hypothetical protein
MDLLMKNSVHTKYGRVSSKRIFLTRRLKHRDTERLKVVATFHTAAADYIRVCYLLPFTLASYL